MISVVGGTYREIDFDEISYELFGSGFRCAKYLLENKCEVKFCTSGDLEVKKFMNETQKVYPKFDWDLKESEALITFKYSFALDEPSLSPGILNIKMTDDIQVEDHNVICFGMMETSLSIKGRRVVYDPQTAVNPIRFKDIGKADELVYIVNRSEAESLASSSQLNEIKRYFFEDESASAFIIKNGPFGANLYYGDLEIRIPSYRSDKVNKIGSGDIFTASFGFYWMELGLSIDECAQNASKSTALFCDRKAFVDITKFEGKWPFAKFTEIRLDDKQIYLAAPFFSIADLVMIDKIRQAFLGFGVNVFSPFHDVGLGDDQSIAAADEMGINNSDVIFGVLDHLDAGTMIEMGYSHSRDKKMICYHRSCSDKDLMMLKNANVLVFNNLTTAIYHAIWAL